MAKHPYQLNPISGQPREIDEAVTRRAYEVYCHLYGPQEAMVTGWCRGGFSVGELLTFLYARSFPKDEWRARVAEASDSLTGVS